MIHLYYLNPNGCVRITRANGDLKGINRYRPIALNSTLPKVLDTLEAIGWINQNKANPSFKIEGRIQTTIAPGRLLELYIENYKVSRDDIGTCKPQEVILLKKGKENFWDTKDLIQYEDTEYTIEARKQTEEINEWITNADIRVLQPSEFNPQHSVIDPSRTQLKRIYNNSSFKSGGRLFGGFWQEIAKDLRQTVITIDGTPLAEFDYKAMCPSLLYAQQGLPLPDHDVYTLPGFEDNEEVRTGAKEVLNSCLNVTKRPTRFPKGTAKYFPKGLKVAQVIDGLLELNEPIAHHFFTGIGLELMNMESELMVQIMLQLKAQGIVALPIHDSILVKHTDKNDAIEVMESTFEAMTGAKPVVEPVFGSRSPLNETELMMLEAIRGPKANNDNNFETGVALRASSLSL